MTATGDRLYSRFRFLVELGDTEQGPHGGFDEVSGIGNDVSLPDYRERDDNPTLRKPPGLLKTTTVTLKSGVIRAIEFRRWLDETGMGGRDAARTVTIRQRNRQHATTSAMWRLIGARIIKHSIGRLNASDMHVVIEELGLVCDEVEIVEA